MTNAYLTYTFVLKDNSKVIVEREAYFGFIFAEGFGLKEFLKIKEDKIFFKRWNEVENFETCVEFLKFLIGDMEEISEDDEFISCENYILLTSKIKKISDIDTLEADYRYYDYDEPEYDEHMVEKISFKKFKADF